MPIRSTTIHRDRERPPVPHQTAAQNIDPYAWAAMLGIELPSQVRLPATERNVYGLPAAWACVGRISNAVATMMAGADVVDGRTVINPRPQVVDRPNFNYKRFEFWKEVTSTALMRGNYVALLTDPDADGWPQQVVPVPIDHVHGDITPEGRIEYDVAGETYGPDQLVHVRIGVTMPGLVMGIGVVEAHRRGLAGQLSQQGMANDVYVHGAVPSGVVQLDTDTPTDAQVTAVKTAWVSAMGGQRTVAVTGRRMNYTPINWSAEDAEFLESRQFSVAECALMFGLRPEDLSASFGASGALTYGNRQDDAIQRIVDSYTPVMQPIEEAWADLLPGRLAVRGNVESLLRSSTKDRFESYKLGREVGVYADEAEVREIEGRPLRQTTEEES